MSTQEDTVLSAPVKVGSRVGLHARPAALVARAVAELDATIRIAKGDVGPIDAASPLLLITLGAACGDEVVVHAEGPGAAEALRQVVELIARDLDDEEEDGG
jgi:phosphocarrier protein HPr